MHRIMLLTAIATLGFSGAVLAQGNGQCDVLQRTVNSPPPSEGALASLEHTVAVLKAAIAMIDLPCGTPYIVSTDRQAILQERQRLYIAWKQTRENCLQITSAQPTDFSPCKEEVSSGQ